MGNLDREVANQLAQLENSLLKFCPTRKWEIQTVVFPSTPNTDLDIAHKLNPNNPEAVDVTVLSSTAPVWVYRDGSSTRVAWSQGLIRVRATTPSARVVLLLSVAADTDRTILDTSTNGFLVPTTAGLIGFDYQSNSSLPDSILGSALHFYGTTAATLGWALGFEDGGSSETQLNVMDLDAAMGAPFQFRKLGGVYYLQPGWQTRNVGGKTVNLGNNVDSGGGGYWDGVYANQFFRKNYSATAQGEWTSVAFASGNFTASSGTWTVDSADQVTFKYTLIGKTMFVQVVIQNTDVSATPNQLKIAIPGSFISAVESWGTCDILDAGANREAGKWSVASGGTVINFMRENAGGANWTSTSSDNTDVRGIIQFEVQ